MKSIIRKGTTAVGLAAALAIASTAYAAPDRGGDAVDGSFVDQTVKITPATKSVGVFRDETVRFVDTSTGESTSWYFDTALPVVSLNIGGHPIKAYVWDQTGEANG